MPNVQYGHKVHILNGYGNWNGGYLDTNGRSTLGDVFDVSTNPNSNRDAS
jgi:hypothetical protein